MQSGTPDWQRTQHAVVASVFIWFAGTNFIMPFLPLYIQELGDLSIARTGLWSGAILASTPLVSGTVAPFWGMLADRYGRKLLLQRSLIGFSVCLGLMGVAQHPIHLLAINAAMGLFGGFSAAAAALVSTTGPAEKITGAVGRVHAARVLGLAVGPLPGGILADNLGYRPACFISMAIGLIAFVIVTVVAREENRPSKGRDDGEPRISGRALVWTPAFMSILMVVLSVRLTERTLDPILPLLVVQTGPSALGIASTTAIIASAGLFATALTSSMAGRYVRDDNRNQILRGSLLLAGIGFAPMFLVGAWWQILIVRILVGLCLGVAFPLALATIATETPMNRRGLALGMLGAGTSYGSSAGFALAGLLSPISLTAIFLVNTVLLGGVAAAHRRTRPGGPAPPDGDTEDPGLGSPLPDHDEGDPDGRPAP